MRSWIVLFCVLSLCLSEDNFIPNGAGPWGFWGTAVRCDAGDFIVAVAVKSEPSQGSGDDTAANAVAFKCGNGKVLKTTNEGPYGNWDSWWTCPSGSVIYGFKTRVEGSVGGGDDTALNNLVFYCRSKDDGTSATSPEKGCCGWGGFGAPSYCQTGGAMIGFNQKVEPNNVDDKTSLNAVQGICDCYKCRPHGDCLSDGSCSCNYNWVGPTCDKYHEPPRAVGVTIKNRIIFERSVPSSNMCEYTFYGYDSTASNVGTAIKWWHSRFGWVNGESPPSSWTYVLSDTIKCSVIPRDNYGYVGTEMESPIVTIGGIANVTGQYPIGYSGFYSDADTTLMWYYDTATLVDQASGHVICSQEGGQLATVASSTITVPLVSSGFSSTYIWIGLMWKNGQYQWMDGITPIYTYWADGHGLDNPTHQCVKLKVSDGTWENTPCVSKLISLCSRPLAAARTAVAYVKRGDYNTFYNSMSVCGGLSGSLVTVGNSAVNYLSAGRFPTWIGLSRNSAGNFTWMSGKQSFANLWETSVPATANCTEISVSGRWNGNNCFNLNQYACEIPLITVTPIINAVGAFTLQLTGPSTLPSELKSRFYLKIFKYSDTGSQVELFGRDYSEPLPYSVTTYSTESILAGTTYYWQMIDLFTDRKITISPVRFKTGCDCGNNALLNGAPRNLTITQNAQYFSFKWRDYSGCDRGFKVTKDGSQLGFLATADPLDCSKIGQVKDLGIKDDISTVPVGTTYRYCVEAQNPEREGYNSPQTCNSATVNWIGTLGGTVTSPSGGVIKGVSVNWKMSNAPSVSGVIVTDASGKFSIDISSPLLTGDLTQNVILTPFSMTGSVFHTFNTSCSDCNSQGNNSFAVPLQHLSPVRKQVSLTDLTVYTISGRVTFSHPREDTTDNLPCAAPNVVICATLMNTVNATTCVNSLDSGAYFVSVPLSSNVTVTASYSTGGKNHTLTGGPYTFLSIGSDKLNYDWVVSTTNQISVTIGGGICTKSLGNANFRIQNRYNNAYCRFSKTITTTGGDTKVVQLPPFDVSVVFDSFNLDSRVSGVSYLDIDTYFQNVFPSPPKTQYASLSAVPNGTMRFEYHSSPKVTISKIGEGNSCGTPGNFVVRGAPDVKPVNVTVRAWESYGDSGNCWISGNVTFWDGLIDQKLADQCKGCYSQCLLSDTYSTSGCPLNLKKADGDDTSYSYAITTTVPGEPNVYAPYTRPFRVRHDPPYVIPAEYTAEVIVTGKVPMDNIFSDEIPLSFPSMILFDPPGGLSYAYIEKGTTLSTTYTTSMSSSVGGGFDTDILAGAAGDAKSCVGFGVTICTNLAEGKILGGVFNEFDASTGSSESVTLSTSVQTTSTIKTSENPGLPPPYGNVIVVTSMTLGRVQTNVISVNGTGPTCGISVTSSNSWLPGVPGYSIRNYWDLINKDVPSLERVLSQEIANGPPMDPTLHREYRNRLSQLNSSIALWGSIIEYHDRAYTDEKLTYNFAALNDVTDQKGVKMSCQVNCGNASTNMGFDTVFFTGGGQTYEYSASLANSKTTGKSSFSELNSRVGGHMVVEAKWGTFATAVDIKGFNTFQKSSEEGVETSTDKTTTVGYVLGDPELGDKFNLQILVHKDFGTPVFRTISGASMCPHEPNTLQRQKIWMDITPPIQNNVPPGSVAIFNLTIQNRGETSEEMPYVVSVDDTTNSNGLSLKLNGNAFTERGVTLGPNQKAILLIEATRSPSAYSFLNIKVDAESPCEVEMIDTLQMGAPPIGVSKEFSVNFLQPCAPLEWASTWALPNDYHFAVNQSIVSQLLEVQLKNPNFPNLRWGGNPRLQSITVEYQAPGRDWQVVSHKNGTAMTIQEDDYGYGTLILNTSTWDLEGVYKLRCRSSCVAIAGINDVSLNTFVTPVRLGRVDRTPPQLFGQFGQPADGSFWPGDEISLEFVEPIDCNVMAYPLEAGLKITATDGTRSVFKLKDPVYGPFLDVLCDANRIRFAFARKLPYSKIMGTKASISVQNIKDLAGNINTKALSWSFDVKTVDLSVLVVTVQDFEIGASLYQYMANAKSKRRMLNADDEMAFAKLFCEDMGSLLLMSVERCVVNEILETETGVNVKWTIDPPSDATETGSAELYEQWLEYMENPETLPAGFEIFQNTSLDNLSYKLETTDHKEGPIGTSIQADLADPHSSSEGVLTKVAITSLVVVCVMLIVIGVIVVVVVMYRRKKARLGITTAGGSDEKRVDLPEVDVPEVKIDQPDQTTPQDQQ